MCSCGNGYLTRGSHLYVTCWSVCDWEHDFWLAKTVLDLLISWSLDRSFKALDHLILYRSKVELELCVFDSLIFAVWRWPWSLDRLSKWSLITWFSFDRGHKYFYTRDISDYPLFDTYSSCQSRRKRQSVGFNEGRHSHKCTRLYCLSHGH